MKYVALIPSYEPTEKLLKITNELITNEFIVVVVNDGSNESYNKIFSKLDKSIHYLSYKENKGKGYALKTGLKYIKENLDNNIVVTMDSDGQHTVKDAKRLCDLVKNEDNTIYLGKRLRGKNTPLRSRLGNSISMFFFHISTGIKIYDTQTGLRSFKSDIIPYLLDIDGNRFDYEMNVIMNAKKNNIKLVEEVIETIYEDNNSGTHFKTIRDSYLIYKEVFKFIFSSISSFIVDYLFYFSFVLLLNKIALANILARILSSLFNYIMNRNVVFKDSQNIQKSIIKYYVLAVCILIVNTMLLMLFVNIIGINKFIAKLIIEIILFFVSFIIQKKYIF